MSIDPTIIKRNVFLSFDAEDLILVNIFRAQTKNEKIVMEFSDYSVKEPFDSNRAEYIKGEIRKLIQKVSVTLCLIGKNTHCSTWVNWEILETVRQGKGILGMRLHSDQFDRPPDQLLQNNAKIVDWNIRDIVIGIENAARGYGGSSTRELI